MLSSKKKKPAALVRSAALLDFDITVGDKLLLRYTSGGELPCDDDELSALAIPEGGHNLIEDYTYILKKDPTTGEQVHQPCHLPTASCSPMEAVASPPGTQARAQTLGESLLAAS